MDWGLVSRIPLAYAARVGSFRLTAEEEKSLDRDGFVLRHGVFSAQDVHAMRAAGEALVAELVKDRRGKRYNVGSYTFESDRARDVMIKWEGDSDVVHGIEPVAHLSPELRGWGYDPRLVDPMRAIVADPDPSLYTEKLNLKRPHAGGVNPLHQDFPYWDGVADDATRVATAMIFLDDAHRANGCLEVLPGSHRRGRWPTRKDGDPFGQLELDPAAAEGELHRLVPIEVKAGAVVFFGPFLVHKSEPNRSALERRALLYSYQPKGKTPYIEIARKLRAARAASSSRA